MANPILDATSAELLIVAREALLTAHAYIDDWDTQQEVEGMIILLERILSYGGTA